MPRAVRRELSDGSAYAGQQRVTFVLPYDTLVSATTVTTGVISVAIPLQFSSIQSFSTRFGSTFDEARLLSATVKIRPVNVSSGVTRFFFDEKSSSAPSIADAQERVGLTLPNTSANTAAVTRMTWRARDLLDLEYSPIGSTVPSAYFKIYTDLATFGAPATVTQLWFIEIDYTVELRGLKAV
jgi:hypothetical protein